MFDVIFLLMRARLHGITMHVSSPKRKETVLIYACMSKACQEKDAGPVDRTNLVPVDLRADSSDSGPPGYCF